MNLSLESSKDGNNESRDISFIRGSSIRHISLPEEPCKNQVKKLQDEFRKLHQPPKSPNPNPRNYNRNNEYKNNNNYNNEKFKPYRK